MTATTPGPDGYVEAECQAAEVGPSGWQRHPGALVCDTVVAIDDSGDFMGTRPWQALIEWLEFHHIDPHDMPAANLITRFPDRAMVCYIRIVTDQDGTQLRDHADAYLTTTGIAQGETPPKPWPAELYAPNGATP